MRIELIAGLLLGALVAGGVQQWRISGVSKALISAEKNVSFMEAQRNGAVEAAEQCSAQVGQLKLLASERARQAEEERSRAAKLAREKLQRSDDILGAPLAFPDDPCASAETLLERWLNP